MSYCQRIYSIAGIVFLLTLSFANQDASGAEPKRVMLLHSFGQEFRPWSEYAKTIRNELSRQSPWPLNLVDLSLISARFSDENAELAFAEYLRALFAKRPLDLIISIGAPAAGFVQRHRKELFPITPMLFTAVEQRRVRYSDLTEHDVVVPLVHDFAAVFENILRVLPDTRTVAVVNGKSSAEQFWEGELRREAKPFENRIAFKWYSELSFEDILNDAAALPPRSAIFWESMSVDTAGVVHVGDTALTRLHSVAKAPIFSYLGGFFGREVVGGPMHSVIEGSRQTVAVAIRILGGEKAADIKIPAIGFATPQFNWREMQRWGISETRLPAGSEIFFRDPTAWEQYRVQILGTVAIVLGQSALIGWLLYEHRRRRRSEAAAHDLSGRLINAHEEERARLARELHDDVTQRLAMLAIDAGRKERVLSGSAADTVMREMREGLVRLSEDVHALSYRLHPSILEDLGLIEALKAECERFSSNFSVRLEANAGEISERLPHEVALCLFRVAQEGLRNIARHAGANRAEVGLRRVDGGLQLVVSDDGAGFDREHDRSRTSLGHASMRQRASLLGGRVDIETNPGHGTTVRAWVPLKEEASEPSALAAC